MKIRIKKFSSGVKYDYYVSDDGRAFKRQKHSNEPLTELKPFIWAQRLYVNAYGRYCLHKLVAKYFVKNEAGLKHVEFVDGNIRNLHYTNLRWV